MQFATCEPKRALQFLQRFYVVEAADIPELIELISQDKARVQDPDFHSPCEVVQGKKFTDGDLPLIQKACLKLAACPFVEKTEND